MKPWELWPEVPWWAKDQISIHVDVHLSWRDRFLLLLTDEFRVYTRTNTEREPGRCESVSRFYPKRIRWPWKRHVLFVESEGHK